MDEIPHFFRLRDASTRRVRRRFLPASHCGIVHLSAVCS
jgi:hypothetical protein